jgi:glycosyltransferase involved in cell wall biosynthesis
VLSTYPPTQCGLATFSAALTDQLNRPAGTAGVVRIVDRPEPVPAAEVAANLVTGSASSTAAAVRRLNGFDAVVVQHEYGIYGGPDGSDVIDIVAALTVPTIIVLHTVLQQPTPRQRRILRWLVESADVLVTMTETARQRLIDSYRADPDAVVVIPHGAIDHGPVDADAARARRLATGRPLVLTWGLLGPGKGIEWAIDALPGLRDLRPQYLVIGKTHPKVAQRDGEQYRAALTSRATTLGVADMVDLDDRYLGVGELAELVQRADVVLLPYDSREQVTSGVLIEAVAAGRPVVSTAFPHAVELLGDGTGWSSRSTIRTRWRRPCAGCSVSRGWPTGWPAAPPGRRRICCGAPLRRATADRRDAGGRLPGHRLMTGPGHFPAPSFEHLRRLTDAGGMYEHADRTEPRPEHGYCVDDVAAAWWSPAARARPRTTCGRSTWRSCSPHRTPTAASATAAGPTCAGRTRPRWRTAGAGRCGDWARPPTTRARSRRSSGARDGARRRRGPWPSPRWVRRTCSPCGPVTAARWSCSPPPPR